MILVTGATGTVGRRLVKHLSNKNLRVRALIHKPETIFLLRNIDVEIVMGDLSQPASLHTAMKGVECIFSIPPNTLNQAELEINLFWLARCLGVKRIVKLSTAKADPNSACHFFKEHWLSEQYLKKSNVTFTVLRSNSFMQNLFWFKEEIKSNGSISLPMQDARIAPVDIWNVVKVAESVLTQEGHEGRIYNVTGPETLSFIDIAKEFSNILGKKVLYIDISPKEFMQILLKKGLKEWFADAVVTGWQIASKSCPIITDTVEQTTKNQPTTFNRFVQNHIDVWS